jgi:hypothetical protein
MSLLPVLWKRLAQLFQVPEDVRLYMLFHFYMPFVKAERESARINLVFQMRIEDTDLDEMMLFRKGEETKNLLTDATIELDTRVHDGRIEKYVEVLKEMLFFKCILFDDACCSVLCKGLIMGDPFAYSELCQRGVIDQCNDAVLIGIPRVLDRIRVEGFGLFDFADFMCVVLYLFEKETDNVIYEILTLAEETMGTRLYRRYFTLEQQHKIKTLGIKLHEDRHKG